jgi:hypothetical protein
MPDDESHRAPSFGDVSRTGAGRGQNGSGRVFYNLTMGIALGIGALQMFRVRGGLVTEYGADVFGTAWLYGMFRQGRTVFQRGSEMGAGATAVFVFAGCAASEVAQRFRLFPGVFDPLDLAAFAVSVAFCYFLDLRFNFGRVT